MSDISNSFGLVSTLEQSMQDRLVLRQAFARSAERAYSQSLNQMRQLRLSCSQFAAGLIQDFSIVSRAGHLAAFEMMTYGEICASLGVRAPAACERLLQCGQALQDRVLSHETRFLDNALSPSDAFYDDLFPLDVMDVVDVIPVGVPHQSGVVNRTQTFREEGAVLEASHTTGASDDFAALDIAADMEPALVMRQA